MRDYNIMWKELECVSQHNYQRTQKLLQMKLLKPI